MPLVAFTLDSLASRRSCLHGLESEGMTDDADSWRDGRRSSLRHNRPLRPTEVVDGVVKAGTSSHARGPAGRLEGWYRTRSVADLASNGRVYRRQEPEEARRRKKQRERGPTFFNDPDISNGFFIIGF